VAASAGSRPGLGTEHIYKIYAESFKDQVHLDAIVSEAQEIVNNALAGSRRRSPLNLKSPFPFVKGGSAHAAGFTTGNGFHLASSASCSYPSAMP